MDAIELIKGKLTLSMVITVPSLNSRSKTKTVTLARYHYVDIAQAKELKAKFLSSNDELVPEFISGVWEFKEWI